MLYLFKSILFWLVVSSGAAFYWPVSAAGFDPFGLSTWMLWALICITMFSLGTLVRPDELKPLQQNPWWVGLGVVVQVLVMPAVAWLVTRVVPMNDELACGVILVGCVPGAMASNVLTRTAGGSVAYSVSLTSVATVFSPVTVPLVLWIVTGIESEHALARSALLLSCMVVLPTLLGFFVVRRMVALRKVLPRVCPAIAAVSLLWIIASVVAGNRTRLAEVGVFLLASLLLINVVGYMAGFGVGLAARLPKTYVRALTLEVGMQNAGLGTALAVSLYGNGTMATIPTAAYTFGCMLTGTILAVWWQRSQWQSVPDRDEQK